MKRHVIISAALLIIFAQNTLAKPVQRDVLPQPQDSPGSVVKLPAPLAKSAVDTTYLLGGPGSWDGSFETPEGQPDWHGWTSEDFSISTENHWHVSTYRAEQIGGHGPGNHVMYCGDENIPACDPPDTIGGYGNDWFEDIEWHQTVDDPGQPVTIRLTGLINHDTEAGYDYIYLLVRRGSEEQTLGFWEDLSTSEDTLDISTVLNPGDFSGPGNDEVRLSWRFQSDSAWSDLDCNYPTHGACQIDDLAVYFDDSLITMDDFEPGNPVNWVQVEQPRVGDFANLRNDLGEIDPCSGNNTWQANFIDDGIVVPGTGGTPCIDHCYDPGGWILNNSGGLMKDFPVDIHLKNRITSPPIAWPAGNDGAELAFDVYRDLEFNAASSGIFFLWYVRSTASSDPADLEYAPWINHGFIELDGGPYFERFEKSVGRLLVPDRQWVQISLVVNELGFHFNINGSNGTPAPYFDNVSLKVWDPVGPEILVSDRHLFGDAFPEAESLDPSDLAANWCRVDNSQILYNSGGALGDSLVALVTSLRHGATLPDPPSLHWVMACNPTFDTVRPDAPDAQGILRGMVIGGPALAGGSQVDNSWAFDLPDTGWFFPGDRLHYYITASDDLDGDLRTSVWPPDTTGVLDFTLGSPFPRKTEIHALPTVTQPVAGQFTQPSLLFSDGADDPEAAAVWFVALRDLGFEQGIDYDSVTVYREIFGVGLGALATVDVLAEYQTMLISSGTRLNALKGEEDSNDAKLVSDWLATGEKYALLAGDGLSSGLAGFRGQVDGPLLLDKLGVQFISGDIADLNGEIRDLQVSPVSGNGVLPDSVQWLVAGGCPRFRMFDAIDVNGNGQVSATLDPQGTTGGPYAALVTVDDQVLGNRTAVMPFDLEQVSSMTAGSGKNGLTFSPQAHLLNYLLFWLGTDVVSGVEDLPAVGQVSVTAHPNPFNPSTTIAFDLPRALEVSLDIFDLQGRLVRRILDESPFATGSHQQVWDGRDAGGKNTASGVYFYRFAAGDQKRVGKLTLLK